MFYVSLLLRMQNANIIPISPTKNENNSWVKQPNRERYHYLYRSPQLEEKKDKKAVKKLPDGLLVVA